MNKILTETGASPGVLRIIVPGETIWHMHVEVSYACPPALKAQVEWVVAEDLFCWLGEHLVKLLQEDPANLARLETLTPQLVSDMNSRYEATLGDCTFETVRVLKVLGPLSTALDETLVAELTGKPVEGEGKPH